MGGRAPSIWSPILVDTDPGLVTWWAVFHDARCKASRGPGLELTPGNPRASRDPRVRKIDATL